MTGNFMVSRDEKTIWRDRGFREAEAGVPKRKDFPSEVARDSYLQGYRLGKRERERREAA